MDPNDLQGNMMKVALRLQNFATEVPLQLSQILLDLETGKLNTASAARASIRSPATCGAWPSA